MFIAFVLPLTLPVWSRLVGAGCWMSLSAVVSSNVVPVQLLQLLPKNFISRIKKGIKNKKKSIPEGPNIVWAIYLRRFLVHRCGVAVIVQRGPPSHLKNSSIE
jgi:hypothetical protein